MILFGAVLSVLPVAFVGAFSYIQSSNQVQERVNQTELQFIRQASSNIEQVLITVDHTLTTLVDSTVMKDALYNPFQAPDFQLYNNLKSEITHLQSFDTKVEDLILVNKQQDWLIKNSGLKRFGTFPDREEYMRFFELPHDSSWVLLETARFEDEILNQSCPYAVSLVKKLPRVRTDKYGLAMANIPACALAGMITNGQDAEEVLIVDEEGRIVVHKDAEMIGKTLSEHPVFQGDATFPEPSGQFQLANGTHPYTVTYHHSTFNRWTYLSVVSIEQLTRESRKIGWVTLIVCLSIVLLSILFVWLTTKRLYLPVSRLVKSIAGEGEEAPANARSEVQMIEDYIQRLFSSKAKLEYELRDHTRQTRSLFLNRLYSGYARQSEIEEKMKYFGFEELARPWRTMALFTLQVDTLENTRFEPKDLELLLFAVSNIIEETVPVEGRFPTVWFDRTLALLVGFEEEREEKVQDLMYELTENLRVLILRYLDLSVSIGISLPFREIRHASRAYEEGMEALRHRLKLGKGVIVPYGTVHASKVSVVYEYPARAEHELIDAIKLADEEEAVAALRHWMTETAELMQSPDEYQLSLMRLLNRLLVVRQEAGIGFAHLGVQRASLYEEFLELQVSEDIEEWFKKQLIVPMVRVFRDRRDSQYQNLSEKIIDLIQNHYDTEFTLEDCAAKLHYNANYLSSVFKAETNATFSEYLANYRLQMAKTWLTQTDMTVKEIAERLKYNNSHNFIRSFRKQEGMTPGQYRSKYAGT